MNKKLIRDNVPKLAALAGDEIKTRKLDDGEFKIELRKKLVEESKDVLQAENKEEILSELVDALELIKTISDFEGFSPEQVEKKRIKKLNKAGGFSKKLFMIQDSKE